IKRQRETYAPEVDMEYNPFNLVFVEWIALKFYNHLEIDWYIKNTLWVYWMRGDDEVVLSNEEVSDFNDENNNDEQEIDEIFRIETNLFETPTKTYEDYENKLNDELGEPWSNDGVPYKICDHICEPLRFKNRKTKWPTCNSNDDGFCNGGELPGMIQVGYMTYFQVYEWYDELTDSSLKEKAMKQKAIYEKSWGDASRSVIKFCAWLKACFENLHELDYELLVKLQDY
nr:hypothetical protein [Tanacetum cinerariifolium]